MKLTSPFQRQIDAVTPKNAKDADLLAKLRECGSASAVHRQYGISPYQVRALYPRYKLRTRRGRPKIGEGKSDMVEMWERGMSLQEIADACCTSKQNVQQHVKRRVPDYDRVDHRSRRASSEQAVRDRKLRREKLLEGVAERLKDLIAEKGSVQDVADYEGVSANAIYARIAKLKREIGVDVRV